MLAALWLSLALAAEPDVVTASSGVPAQEETVAQELPVDESSVAERPFDPQRPWKSHRLLNVTHPTPDPEFLEIWRPRFYAHSRLAEWSPAIGFAGLGVAFVGLNLSFWVPSVGSYSLLIGGIALGVGGPILGLASSMKAAKILRAGGVRVPVGWAVAGYACLGLSLLAYPAIATWPTAMLMPVIQSSVNRAAMRRALASAPLRVHVLPMVDRDRRGMALVVRW